MAVLDEINMVHDWGGEVAMLAVNHDLDEVVTGDIPTPAKKEDRAKIFKGPITPKMIVKMADIIDAYTFIVVNKIDRHGEYVATYMHDLYNNMLDNVTGSMRAAICQVVTNILEGDYA